MSAKINGLHHVTALASDPQRNVDFYAGILGLRMLKKTVNFDAPNVYHLYYGNKNGQPGTIMTFFPFSGLRKGRKGIGQVTVTSFSIAENALEYWMRRLKQFNIPYTHPQERFDERYIYFEDHDGLGIELVANPHDSRPGFSFGQIPPEYAIKGFYSVGISAKNPDPTTNILQQQLNHSPIQETANRIRLGTADKAGALVDIIYNTDDPIGMEGSGIIHHVAFSISNDEEQLAIREKLVSAGQYVTPVKDRQYFNSIYFREPGGVLFEVATDPPGFTIDEDLKNLGKDLKLPPWEESRRAEIESGLTPISLNIEKFHDK